MRAARGPPGPRRATWRHVAKSPTRARVAEAVRCPEDANEINSALCDFLQSMETPDDLNMFFAQVHKLVWRERRQESQGFQSSHGGPGCVVEPHSLLGVFLRECCVGFELLSFEGVGRLLRRVGAFQGGERCWPLGRRGRREMPPMLPQQQQQPPRAGRARRPRPC